MNKKNLCMRYIKQILTALQSDNGGNHHPSVLSTPGLSSPRLCLGDDSRPGVDSTSGVIISTIILLSSQYLYTIYRFSQSFSNFFHSFSFKGQFNFVPKNVLEQKSISISNLCQAISILCHYIS